jgi:putative hydrolase of the HAD superfamily
LAIKNILFDLDDTLYPTSAGLMHEISERMNEYMIAHVGIPVDEVAAIRQDYWKRYGTTLRGLYIERHIDAQAFLEYVHDIPISGYLEPDARLDAVLSKLPQDKYVFTNAPTSHARRVLAALGIERHFAGIFDINFIEYESKPTLSAYHKVLSALGVPGPDCLMIDDSARNLAPAQALGMRTVLLDGKGLVAPGSPLEGVDEIITTIYDIQYVIRDAEKGD